MKSNRNERKICVLNILSYYSARPKNSRFIHDLCPDISLASLCTSLKRYYVQGLLKRKRVKNKFYYKISKKGLARLEHLIGGKQTVKEKIEMLVTEPIRKIRLLEREPIKNIEKLLKM